MKFFFNWYRLVWITASLCWWFGVPNSQSYCTVNILIHHSQYNTRKATLKNPYTETKDRNSFKAKCYVN